jgi:hypothetical protein
MMMIFSCSMLLFDFEMQQRLEKGLGEAAIDTKHLRVYPSAVRAGEERHDASDVFSLAQPF